MVSAPHFDFSAFEYSVDNEKDETLCLCKLKTIEYRIYRKLREKLRK